MNPIEKFREVVTNASSTALAAGAEPAALHHLLFEFSGLDTASARDAAENLDQLIDGNDEDDLGIQLTPARDLLRRLTGS